MIPAGSNTVTYPLNQIASSQVGNSYSVFAVIVGALLLLSGLAGIFGFDLGAVVSLVFILLGALLLLAGIKAGIRITNTGGDQTSLNIVPWEKAAAQNFVNSVNTMLVERMN